MRLPRFITVPVFAAFAAGAGLATGGWTLISGPVPVSITLSFPPLSGCQAGGAPSYPCAAGQVPNNAKAGTVIANATVQMSDGSTNYKGVLTSTPGDSSGIFPGGPLPGSSVALNRDLGSADDGPHNTVITAQ